MIFLRMILPQRVLFLIALLLSSPVTADYPVEIIELQGRQVEELIPVIRPFLMAGGSMTGMHNQLIIKTSPDNLQEIRRILERIDRAPRRLMIHVRQDAGGLHNDRALSADLDARVGEKSRVTIGQPADGDSVRIHGWSRHTSSDLDQVHKVQALEGHPAFISTGRSIPTRDRQVYAQTPFPYYQNGITYRNATTGFLALPRVNGNQVTLEISPHMDRPSVVGGSFDVHQASTILSGVLGQWIDLGGAEEWLDSSSTGIIYRAGTKSRSTRSLSLMVEEIH